MNNSDFFSFLECSKFEIRTYFIDFNLVRVIRRCLRSIYSKLLEADADNTAVVLLRLELLRLQSSPVIPSPELLKACGLNDSKKNEKVWGSDIANTCNQLEKAISALNQNKSPLLTKLVEVVSSEIESCGLEKLKIWCYRKEREAFIELFAESNILLTNQNFINSLADYKKLDFFTLLVRLGPLRTQGWSKTASVILTAPRYIKLLRFVWSHSLDEEGFGREPVLGSPNYLEFFEQREETIVVEGIKFDDVSVDNTIEEVDDFIFLAERPVKLQSDTSCVLIEFSGGNGVLLLPGSHQLIFDQEKDNKCITYKDAKEIEPGNFLLLHDLEVDLGGNVLTNNRYKLASIWKQDLHDNYYKDSGLLINKMRKFGIDLQNLESAARRWMQLHGEVIFAPQNRRHFQLLIENILTGCMGKFTWQQAWREIQDSRIQAIRDGRIEHAIVNNQLVEELKRCLDSIREKCSGGDFFRKSIAPSSGMSGTISFFPVLDVSAGFKAPHDIIGDIKPVIELELYRMEI